MAPSSGLGSHLPALTFAPLGVAVFLGAGAGLQVMSNLFVDQGLVEEDIIEAAASNLVILNTIEDLHLGSRVKIFKSFTKVYKSTLSA